VDKGVTRVTQPTLDVLEALLKADGELYGYQIIKRSKRSGPTVYKILERLTGAGWLDERWEDRHPTEGKPRRRFYRLNAEGAPAARACLAQHRGPRRSVLPRLAPLELSSMEKEA
jgi:DNA-binding PadR family transcriptional regulator